MTIRGAAVAVVAAEGVEVGVMAVIGIEVLMVSFEPSSLPLRCSCEILSTFRRSRCLEEV